MAAEPVSQLTIFNLNGSSYEGQNKLLAATRPVSGFQGGHWGIQHEDEKALHWLVNWDSISDHQKLRSQPELSVMMDKILTWATGIPTTIHAALKPFPPPVETAPVVEWCTVTLSPDTNKEDFIVNFKEFEKGLKGEGYNWHSSGWVVEKERDYLLLIGWDSVKAHADWRASEIGQEAVGYLKRGVDNIHMVHINYGGDIPKQA